MTERNPNLPANCGRYSFEPQEDITAFELAQILKHGVHSLVKAGFIEVDHEKTPSFDRVKRHFTEF
jgi:hypothetical protein